MKSSCVQHPTNHRLIIIRQWQVEFCDGNHCAAALLSFFEYWHNIRLDMSQKAREMNEVAEIHGDQPTQDESLHQFHTAEQLQAGLLNLYGEKKIREARQLLIQKGVLTEYPNPNPRYKFDKTTFFLFHPEIVNAWLAERYPPDSLPLASGTVLAGQHAIHPDDYPSGKNAGSNGKNAGSNGKNAGSNGKNADGAGKNAGPIKETTTEITPGTSSENTTTTQPSLARPRPTGQPEESSSRRQYLKSDSGSRSAPSIAPPTTMAVPPSIHHQPPALIFDFHLANLSQEEQTQLSQRLSRLPQPLAQQVLDEYNSALGRNMKFRSSRQAWLESLIRSAQTGLFTPTSDLPERRQVQARAVITRPPERFPSQAWESYREELKHELDPKDFFNIMALRGTEDGSTLWLEAPNPYVVDWVAGHLPVIEQVLRPHTPLAIAVRIDPD